MEGSLGFVFKIAVSVCGASAYYLFGGWSALLGVLLTFVIVDYISGVVASWHEGELSSKVGLLGITKKVFIFVMVAVAHLIDTALGTPSMFRAATGFFYMANELLSIIENVGRIGLPVPEPLKRAVEILNSKGETGENEK